MAARRAAAAAAASPAGLKIKVKAGVKARSKACPPESGEPAIVEPKERSVVTNSNARMLKRKRLTPPGSPALSKKQHDANTANGEPVEPVEPVPKKLASNIADLNAKEEIANKQDATKPEESTASKLEKGVQECSNSKLQGDLQVSSEVAAAAATVASGEPKADVSVAVEQSLATGVKVSSSLATSSVMTQAEEKKLHTVPSHAGWFSWTEVHTLEKRGVPDFFSGKVLGRTPELYLEYRNIIVKKYREHLGTVITVADLQEHLSGVDEKAIFSIMEFLDHWGIINYHAPTELLPPWRHCSPVVESDAALMLRALPRKGSSLYHVDSNCAPVIQQIPLKPKTMDAVLAEMLAFGEGAEVDYHCNSCGADCSKQRYHCQKQADFDLCSNCYNEGLFGPDMVSADFIKMDVTEASNANGGGWTDQETLLLLEALELYGDNWNEIAEHVATKSKSQCIMHFLRLPVEDSYSEDADNAASTSNANNVASASNADNAASTSNVNNAASTSNVDNAASTSNVNNATSTSNVNNAASTSNAAPATTPISQTDRTLEAEQEKKEEKRTDEKAPEDDTANVPRVDNAVKPRTGELVLPPYLAAFAEAGNPVMAQMAFLATMIGSKLGGEAAQAALATLTTKDPGVRLAAGTAIFLEDPVADVEPSTSQHPDRSGQAAAETQSGEETAPTGDAGPSPAAETKPPEADGTASASAPTGDDAPTQPEPRQEPNLGKEIVQKSDGPVSLNVLGEAKMAGRVKRAAASAVGAASVRAKLLADQENREMQRLLRDVIDHQVKILEMKLKLLNEFEDAIGKECDAVDRTRLNFFSDHARLAAQHRGGALNSNSPPSPPMQQQEQQQQQLHQALVLAQAPPPLPFQGQMYGHGFQAGVANHQMPNHAAFVQQQMYQGLANSMNAGAMTMQQGHFQRQMMIAGTAPHMLGRPQEITPPQVMMGMMRPLMSSEPPPGLPGLTRPVPGGALGGLPQ